MLRRWRIGLLIVVLVAPLFAVAAIELFGSSIARHVVVREVGRVIPADVRFGTLVVSALPPRVSAGDVEISDAGVVLVRVPRLRFDLAILSSLWNGAWIGDVTADEPTVLYREGDRFWTRLAAAHESRGGVEELPVLPRSLIVRSARGRLEIARLGLAATVDDLALEATVGGLVRLHARFDGTARVSIERSGRRLELRRVAVRGRGAAGDLRIDAGVVDGDSGSLRWQGRLAGERLSGRIVWDAALDPIFALLPEAPVVHGGGTITATVSGRRDEPAIEADLRPRGVRIGDVEFSGEGRLTSRGRQWTLDPAHAEIFGGAADGTAHGEFSAGVPFRLAAHFRGWDPATFIRLFGPQTPLRGSWSGQGTLIGHLAGDDLRGGGDFSLEAGGERLVGEANFTVAKDRAAVAGGVDAGAADHVHCRYEVVQHSEIRGEVEATTERLALFGPFVGLRLGGAGSGRAEFAGTAENPLFRGSARALGLSVESIPIGDVEGPFEISPSGVRSDGIAIDGGAIAAHGRIALTRSQENDWSAVAHGAPVRRALEVARTAWPWLPDAAGRADGEVSVSGPWPNARLLARTEIAETEIAGQPIGSVAAQVSLEARRWAVRAAVRGDATAEVDASIGPDGAVSGKLAAGNWKLERIRAVRDRVPDAAGVLGARASFSGSIAHPLGEAEIRIGGLALGGQSWGDAVAGVRLDGERATVDARAGERVHASLAALLRRPGTFQLRGEWRDVELGSVLAPDTGIEIRATGSGELAGDVETPLGRGSARVTALSIGRGAQALTNGAPIVLQMDRGTLELADVPLEGGGQRVTVGGRFAFEESAFHAVARGDLSLLESLTSSVASARGGLEAEIRGTKRQGGSWTYEGRARVTGGALDLGLLVGLTDVAGEAVIDGRRLEVRGVGGRVGGGEFSIAGALDLDGGWDLGWTLENANLGVPSWLDYLASGNGRFVGPRAAPKLVGEIHVAQAVYDRRVEWAEFLPWFRRQARPSRTGTALPVTVDVHVVSDGGLFVDNNLAKAELRGDLELRGPAESPTLSGVLEVVSGDIIFRRRRFAITSGSVRFHADRPANPDLQLEGETSVATRDADYQIELRVSGSADNPRIQFTADDPSLSENDVLALVTFGRTVADLQGEGGGIELGEVLAITGPRGNEAEREIHTLLRVDRIEIEPAYSRVSGVTEPRLSIAKDLTDRFSAVLGTGLGGERQHDVGLEYQLTPRLSVQGLWESETKQAAGTFGGSLKFRVPFRSFTLLPDAIRGVR